MIIAIGLLGWWLWEHAEDSWDFELLYYIGGGFCCFTAITSIPKAFKSISLYRHQLYLRHGASYDESIPQDSGKLMSEKEMEAANLFDPNRGQLTGSVNGRPFFVPFVHSLIISPPGKGKTTTKVIPALCHGYRVYNEKLGLSHVASAIVTDLKWELKPMTARLRKEQYDHEIIILSPSHPDTSRYEPLNLVTDAIESGDTAKAISIAEMIAHILEPEPKEGGDAKGKFFRLGPRAFILFTILHICDIKGKAASILDVTDWLGNDELILEAVEGRLNSDAFHGELAKQAHTINQMGKYTQDHLLSARFALNTFGRGRQVANCLGRSDIRWRELKKSRKTVYIGCSLAEQEAFKPWLKLMVECICIELQDKSTGGNIPVEFLLEESTNFQFDISGKLAALRGAGVRVTIIVQSFSEIVRVFGKHAADAIWNMTDLKVILGGFHDITLAEKASTILGKYFKSTTNYQKGKDPYDDVSESVNTQLHPAMEPDEIMSMEGQLVLLSSIGKSIRSDKVSYAQVSPWSTDWLDDNPLEGEKLKADTTIKLDYRNVGPNGGQNVLLSYFKRTNVEKSINNEPSWCTRHLWFGFTALYTALLLSAVNMNTLLDKTPHLLWNYEYQQLGSQKYYTSCMYIGFDSTKMLYRPGKCPIIKMISDDIFFSYQSN